MIVEQADDVDKGFAQDGREDALSDVDRVFDQRTILIAWRFITWKKQQKFVGRHAICAASTYVTSHL